MLAGACPNENSLSDYEYDLKIISNANLTGFLTYLLGGDDYLTPPVLPEDTTNCTSNHKGRVCQEVLIGDISIDINSDYQYIYVPGDSVEVSMGPGRTCHFVVHNNGAFGISYIERTVDEIHGFLNATGLESIDGQACIRHWEKPQDMGLNQYFPDRDATFEAPADAAPGSRDTYEFSTDGRIVTVTFLIVADITPSPSPSPEGLGTVRGTITCNVDGPLDATVTIGGQQTVAAAGNYEITNVPAGTHSINASFPGHQNYTGTVTVTSNQTTTHNITLIQNQ